jgi:hypothetical protein
MKDIIISFMNYYKNIDPRVMLLELIKAMKYIILLQYRRKDYICRLIGIFFEKSYELKSDPSN